MARTDVVVIGAGQAGLSASYFLREQGIDHLVLERAGRVGDGWRRNRWDSFRLVTPNWQWRVPGTRHGGDDPDGFMTHQEVADRLERLAARPGAEIRTDVTVESVEQARAGDFELRTSQGMLRAARLIGAAGTYHEPAIPALASRLGPTIRQLPSSAYRRPDDLPRGGVLVVGSGQSGFQIARELHAAGRRVHWSLGRASRLPRRYRGQDIFRWMHQLGLLDLPITEHPAGRSIRCEPKPFICGDGPEGPEDPRRLAQQGMVLHGRLEAVTDRAVRFADDMRERLRDADDACRGMATLIDTFLECEAMAAPAPELLVTPYDPPPSATELDLEREGIGTVIWCTGYRSAWPRWLRVGPFDTRGYPVQERGVSPVPGLFFVGLDWMHTWGSGLLYGVAGDATHVVTQLSAHR